MRRFPAGRRGALVDGRIAGDAERLALLLEVSKELTRVQEEETLFEKLLGFASRLLDVDLAAILIPGEKDDLDVRAWHQRQGTATGAIPVELARISLEERVALLSDFPGVTEVSDVAIPGFPNVPAPSWRAASFNTRVVAGADGTILTLGAAERPGVGEKPCRSALCAPLLAGTGQVLGVLYIETRAAVTTGRSHKQVNEDDLEFLVAFAGIGAVALENLRFAERSRQETLIRTNFERFFPPHLAARIAQHPASLKAGGERRHVAVLFTDIRGFTPLAARLTPDATAQLLTEYFSEMAECVFQHGGTLDKFIGDAVMAQWGAPERAPDGDEADRALEAARAMLERLERLNTRWAKAGRPVLEVGVGLNYGEVFAGTLGSERRLEYTVIGDVVNTASRLCEVAQGGEILLTPAFQAALTRPHTLVPHAGLQLPFPVLLATR